jgi:hypothetical protein
MTIERLPQVGFLLKLGRNETDALHSGLMGRVDDLGHVVKVNFLHGLHEKTKLFVTQCFNRVELGRAERRD